MSIDKLKTKFFTGAWLTDVKHYFTKINEIIDYLNNLVSYSPPYKVYTALLTQTGTDAPVAIILENTLGAIVWSRSDQGGYNADLVGAFPEGKTFLMINKTRAGGRQFSFYRTDDNQLEVFTESFDPWESWFLPTDGIMTDTPVEIRVYP